jgi:hypothetical protein
MYPRPLGTCRDTVEWTHIFSMAGTVLTLETHRWVYVFLSGWQGKGHITTILDLPLGFHFLYILNPYK